MKPGGRRVDLPPHLDSPTDHERLLLERPTRRGSRGDGARSQLPDHQARQCAFDGLHEIAAAPSDDDNDDESAFVNLVSRASDRHQPVDLRVARVLQPTGGRQVDTL